MTFCRPRTIERLRFVQRHFVQRLDKFEELPIWRFSIKIVSLVANSITPTALHPMVIVVEHFLERPFVNHRLVSLHARPLFSLERFDRDRAKLDSFDGLPRLLIALENLHAIESRRGECREKPFLRQRPRDAAAPKF